MRPDVDHLTGCLARTPEVLRALLAGYDPRRAREKAADGGWSVLEILGHMVDEEREDFVPRLFSTLEDPSHEWPAIDPEGRVVERDWNASGNLDELLFVLTTERASALARLRVWPNPDWTRTYAHPVMGPLSAGDLLLSWATHDQLHLRQILARLYAHAVDSADGASAAYAGPW